jgi:rSAM/selenodomain-associated transferase 1
MRSTNALCLFIKSPRLGQVKTRMQPEIAPKDALRLYRAMVEDLLDRLRRGAKFDLHLFFWPPHCGGDIEEWLGDRYGYLPQEGGDLGERMYNALRWAHEHQYHNIVIVGGDIPMLGANTIAKAFDCLRASDVVLGPTPDGGYYLIGMKHARRDLFTGIPWSTNRVYEDTLEKMRRLELSFSELDAMDDLDTFEDARTFWRKAVPSSQGEETNRTVAILNSLFGGNT